MINISTIDLNGGGKKYSIHDKTINSLFKQKVIEYDGIKMGQDEWSTTYRLRIPVESGYQIFSYHALTVGSVLPINCNIPMDDGGALVVFIDNSHKGENVGGEWRGVSILK